jgi:hypothetical protein
MSDTLPVTLGCLKCLKDPAQLDDQGFSLCCGVYRDRDENTGDLRYKPPTDPLASSRSSQYRGVTRVVHATRGRVTYRVQLSCANVKYYVAELRTERDAAIVFDNAVYYLNLEGNFFRPDHTPAPNFPEHYAKPEHVPPPFKATQRLLRRLRTENLFVPKATK